MKIFLGIFLALVFLAAGFGCIATQQRVLLVTEEQPFPMRLYDSARREMLDTVTDEGVYSALLPGDCVRILMISAPAGILPEVYRAHDWTWRPIETLSLVWRDHEDRGPSGQVQLGDNFAACTGRMLSL